MSTTSATEYGKRLAYSHSIYPLLQSMARDMEMAIARLEDDGQPVPSTARARLSAMYQQIETQRLMYEHSLRLMETAYSVGSEPSDPPSVTEYLSVEQVAEMIGKKVSYVYQLTSKKQIPFIKSGRHIRFEPDAIREWMKEGRVEVRDEAAEEALMVVKGIRDRRRKRLW